LQKRTRSVASQKRAAAQGRGDEEDIAEVVSRWTGVPVTKLLEGEMQKLLHLETSCTSA
jgi:ATP-dependent Clp protease ATP-binding subunit ClpA